MRATPYTHDELERISRNEPTNLDLDAGPALLAQEVLYQRQWLARVARIIEAQTLDLKSLAKCRREALEGTVDDLRELAVGHHVPVPSRLDSEYRFLREGRR